MSTETKKKFMGIDIPTDLTKFNFLTLFFCTTLGGVVTNSINGIQPSYLKDYLKVSEKTFGTVNGSVLTVGEIAAVIFLFVFGALSDKKGRKFVISVGLAGAAISYIFFCNSHILGNLFGIDGIYLAYAGRFIIVASVAGVWATFITITADYTDEANRAKGMSLNGIFTGFGMLLAMGVFATLPRFIGVPYTFYLVSFTAILTLLYVRIGLVDRKVSKEQHMGQLKNVINFLKTSPQMLMCYAARFFVMAAITTVGTFIFIWAVNASRQLGVASETAQMRIGIYIFIAGMFSFPAFPVFAILCDKIGRFKTLAISFLIAGGALISFGLIENPLSLKILPCMVVFFISQAGMLLTSQTLASELSPKPLMGTMLGGLSTCGQLGAGLFFSVSGVSMDKLGAQAPYMIIGVFCLLMIVWVLAVEGKALKKN